MRAEGGRVRQVVLRTGAVYEVRAAILGTGTYLQGRTIVGECIEDSGPDGMHAAGPLTEALQRLDLPLRRFKTGTPPRVNARSIDFSKMEVQRGDEDPLPFILSDGAGTGKPRRLLAHLHHRGDPPRSSWRIWTAAPSIPGVIEGVGPRYCPSHRDEDRPLPG